MEITVRRITLADADALSAIAKQTFFDTFKDTCSQTDMQEFLQEYFNEVTYETCGICDVCLDRKKKDNNVLVKDYTEQVVYLLDQRPLGVDELETAVAARDKELFIEVVRELVDAGTIVYDEHWVLHKR